jgi:DNA polymerase sigma
MSSPLPSSRESHPPRPRLNKTHSFGSYRNLQRLPLPRALPLEELEYEGHDISFYDDLEALPRVWQTNNQENVGQLLVEFFRYFSKDFMYNSDVVSIRSATGIVGKDIKGWFTDVSACLCV